MSDLDRAALRAFDFLRDVEGWDRLAEMLREPWRWDEADERFDGGEQ